MGRPQKPTQGKYFPGYEDQTTTEDRKQRIRNSDPALAYTPNDFLKHQYPLKTQWDGSISGYNENKSQMEGFYIQNRAWFMFDETFQKTYFNFGLDYVTGNPNLPMTMNLTKSMIINARTHL